VSDREAGSGHEEGFRPFVLEDDGTFPNSRLPVLIYTAVRLPSPDLAGGFERLFQSNGWGGTWRDGIYDFHHYHSTAHEVLGIAGGTAVVQLGGPSGVTLEVRAGQCLILPAGTAHKRIRSSRQLLVVGAYPAGQEPDLCRGVPADRPAADRRIAGVPLPARDPVLADRGLGGLWRSIAGR